MTVTTYGDDGFEKVGNYEKDLIAILREKSPKFNELIDKQVSICLSEHLSIIF